MAKGLSYKQNFICEEKKLWYPFPRHVDNPGELSALVLKTNAAVKKGIRAFKRTVNLPKS